MPNFLHRLALLCVLAFPLAGTSTALAASALPPPGDLIGWVTISSLDSALAIADEVVTMIGKGGPKPSASALPVLGASAGGIGLKDVAWLDTRRPIRAMLFDAPAGQREAGLVLAVPLISPTKLMAAVKDAPVSQTHFLELQAGTRTLYVDTVPGYAIFAVDSERFSKIQAWVSSAGWVGKPPGALSFGVDVRNAARAYEAELNQVMAKVDEAMQGAATTTTGGAGGDLVKQAMAAYVAILRSVIEEMDTLETYVDLREGNFVLGYRVTALQGTPLEQLVTSGRGRQLQSVTAWVPRSSYVVALTNDDPAGKRAFLAQMMQVVGGFLGLDKPGALATTADYHALMDLSTGEGALAFYADGDAAIGLLSVTGYKDGKRASELGSKLARQGLSKLLDFLEAQDKAEAAAAVGKKGAKGKGAAKGKGKGKAAAKGGGATGVPSEGKQLAMRLARQSVAQASLAPFLSVLQTKLPPAIKLTQGEVHEAGLDCDTLTFAVDWSAFPTSDARVAKVLVGSNYVTAICTLPKALVIATGPHAIEEARRVAAGQTGGVDSEPTYRKAMAAAPSQPSGLFYLRPAPLVTAVGALVPPHLVPRMYELGTLPDVPVWGVGLQAATMEARFSLPVSWILWGVGFARSDDAPAMPKLPVGRTP